MIKWSGRILVFLGTGHTLLALALTLADHAGTWFTGVLWGPDEGVITMSQGMAAYWLTIGSFGPPLVVLGLAVLWTQRRGIVPPAFIGWALLAWTVCCTVILLPSPWILGVIASVLYLVGVRRAAAAERVAAGQN
ncbi:DUF6463 family protein [Glycomyces sp. NPDC046736]|uniref:DUF6463 family protein n=1 Tax=Glycomyces sp. NPDC046736 TaxID=3155615 RepID=UPI0033D2EE32